MSEEERGEVSFSEELSGATQEVVLGGLSGCAGSFTRRVTVISFLPVCCFLIQRTSLGVFESLALAALVCVIVLPILTKTRVWWVVALAVFVLWINMLGMCIRFKAVEGGSGPIILEGTPDPRATQELFMK